MEKYVHRENPQKLYIQLEDILKRKIESKEWDIGFRIPTESDLCKIYEVSRATVRAAVSELVRHGYLARQQGKGTFVCKKISSDELTMMTSFRESMIEADTGFTTDVLAKTTIMPVDDLSIKLNIPPHEHIIYIKRLFNLVNKPILIQETYIPVYICPSLLDEDVRNNSLFELLEKKYEIQITRVKNYFDIAHLNMDEARIFDSAEGLPALVLNQHLFSWKTQIMYARSISLPDRFKFSLEFEKAL